MVRHETSWKTAAAEKLLATSCSRIPTVARYALDVLTGNVPAGRMVFLAVERFLNDLKRSQAPDPEFPYYFDQGGAVAIIKFFRDLAFHTKPLIGYEQFIVANLFGWKKIADGFRRFDEAYIEMGKGNRKTPLAAGIGIYGIIADEEPAAEVYIVAPTKDQAAIAFKDASTMVDGCPELKKLIKKFGCSNKFTSGNLSHGASFMRPVAADRDTLDGPRPHIVIVDEEHEHKDPQVVGKLIAGFKARRQPLCFKITNSGWDRETICWEDHELARKVLERVLRKDSFFTYVCHLDVCAACREKGKDIPSCDDCDNWLDEDVWIKTNPALGVIVTKEYLRKQVKDALDKPTGRNLVLRLNFCIWTQSIERFISPEAWRACAWETGPAEGPPFIGDPVSWRQYKIDSLKGCICFGGLDLGAVNDFTCLALYFPVQKKVPKPVLLVWAWVPEDVEHHKILKERYGYEQWVDGKFLKLTGGVRTDYNLLREDILQLDRDYSIEELAFDPRFSFQLVQELGEHGVNVVEHRQGPISMTGPIQEFHRQILGQDFVHGANPYLTFNIDNLVVEDDGRGNLMTAKPGNPNSPRKIDAAQASIMAGGRSAANPGAGGDSGKVFFA